MNNSIPSDSGSPRLVRISDAARDLALSERYLRQQVALKRIPAVRLGRALRLSQETVQKLAREGL